MNADELFNAGTTADIVPEGDAARQAVDSLRGYAYQALATALAWLDIDENGRLFLEVAEDYAIVAKQALQAVQVKDTKKSESVTLNSGNIQSAVAAFVDLVERNPGTQVFLRYFTTSEIGTEKAIADRPAGMAGLDYWRKVATGAALAPLRTILESHKYPETVRAFSKARDDATLRRDLIRRIHWECGKPDFSTLRQELEERLVVVGRDQFNLPASEAQRLADPLVCRVLKKSIVETPRDRVLTRAELYKEIDAATRTSMPRAAIDTIAQIVSGLAGSLGGDLNGSNLLSAAETSWLIDGTTLPTPEGMIARDTIETAVANALTSFGVSVLVGGSGLGKSNVSRAVAVARADEFFLVDFRNTKANETRRRLDMVFARIGGLTSPVLILEDLNYLDETSVGLSLARVIEALRRRDREVLITCYRKPSISALAGGGLSQGCVVDCPYFLEEEAHALVRINGGDPGIWGHLAYVAGASGHPQLTHAFVIGMAARKWPADEIQSILNRGLSSDDIDATRNAARGNLLHALPEGTRNLLYRLSLTIGRFNRSLALTIGEIPPPVSQSGECMDQLVGPWIEAIGKDLYRVSPLASGFGNETLPLDEQKRIHETIAVQMLRKRTIDVIDADTIMVHAISGKSSYCLAMLAQSVLMADFRTLEMLAENLSLFRLFRTDVAIYPENLSVSGMLRLAQFKLAAAVGEGNKVSDIASALFNEISGLPEGEIRRVFEAMAVTSVLSTMGVANYLDNWIALLNRFKGMIEADEFLQDLKTNVESADDATGSNFLGVLFGIGSANLASVDRLEHVINELDELDANERALWLRPIDKTFSDYSVFINGAWATQERRENFDAADAATRYRRMAEKTRNWGIRPLSLQCSVAWAIMLDEYQHDKEGALAVLEEAMVAQGDDLILARARARVLWRQGEHETALEILRDIADQVGADSPVERSFALREAAISAAKCGKWSQSEEWFLDAQGAAKLAQGDDMDVMAVGLGADSAVAALEAGNVSMALKRLAEAVEALASIKPEATLRAAYCHRVIRHTVLWAQSRIERNDVEIDGKPIRMEAGTCSNPDPLPAIRELPVGHIDLAWYMLAQAETSAGLDVGITATLGDRLTQGSIPVLEVSLRTRSIQADIGKLDAAGFAAHFTAYVEAAVYLSKEAGKIQATFDPLALERGQIPALNNNPPFDPVVEQVAADAVLAYGILSAIENQPEALKELEAALDSQFAGPYPGKLVINHWNKKRAALEELDKTVATIIKDIHQNEHLEPRYFWMAGLRFFEQINQSNFKTLLTARIADWQTSGWKRITTQESFRLSRPLQTVPIITEVLATPAHDQSYVAKLILATSEAVGSPLGSPYTDRLRAIANEAEQPPTASEQLPVSSSQSGVHLRERI